MKTEAKPPHPIETGLDAASYLPRMRTLNLAAIVIAAGALFVWPTATNNHIRWTGGPLTNHHRLLERDCSSCHTDRFVGAPDGACIGCHAVHEHAAPVPSITSKHPELASRCAGCHREHHGEQNLVPVESLLCTSCHGRMRELLPGSSQASFDHFSDHPDFMIEAWGGNPMQLSRRSISEPGIRAATQIKFSHALHLSMAGPDSPAMTCASCHAVDDSGDVRPVSFADHCARCHALALDDRADSPPVPHAEPTHLYAFVRGEMARRRLFREPSGSAATGSDLDAESREHEAGLFTEGGTCVRCHDVEDVPDVGADASRFRVLPLVQGRRMAAASFGHATHRLTECQACHAGVPESQSAGDVLLPSIAVCRQCHADPGTRGKVDSPCLQCHLYHGTDH